VVVFKLLRPNKVEPWTALERTQLFRFHLRFRFFYNFCWLLALFSNNGIGPSPSMPVVQVKKVVVLVRVSSGWLRTGTTGGFGRLVVASLLSCESVVDLLVFGTAEFSGVKAADCVVDEIVYYSMAGLVLRQFHIFVLSMDELVC
jgi:hypothetical protein